MYGTFTLYGLTSQTVPLSFSIHSAVHTPWCTHHGLGSFPFARRYSGNRFFFLFLRLLRCFSSAGSLHMPMDSAYDDWGLLSRVSPFGNQRVNGYLLLTAAYRSLSRPSSALSAKASTLRPLLLNLPSYRSFVWCGLLFSWFLMFVISLWPFLRAYNFRYTSWIFVSFGCLVNYCSAFIKLKLFAQLYCKWLSIIISLYEVLKVHWTLNEVSHEFSVKVHPDT